MLIYSYKFGFGFLRRPNDDIRVVIRFFINVCLASSSPLTFINTLVTNSH